MKLGEEELAIGREEHVGLQRRIHDVRKAIADKSGNQTPRYAYCSELESISRTKYVTNIDDAGSQIR